MSDRESRLARPTLIPALLLIVWLAGTAALVWRAHPGATRDRGGNARDGRESTTIDELTIGPTRLNDPRLQTLRETLSHWRTALDRQRVIVDQVCLVRDVPAFLDALAAWDERHFFPILIDDPAWTLPFLRAFRPARVVRYEGRGTAEDGERKPLGPEPPASRDQDWLRALAAVARAWSSPETAREHLPNAAKPSPASGAAPGVIVADPAASMFAGAVALAAGRFEPMVRVGSLSIRSSAQPASPALRGFNDVLTLEEAALFAKAIESRVAAVFPNCARLGDDCDFVTLAGDWPYRYAVDEQQGPVPGSYATDDLVGRVFAGELKNGWLARSRRRWAYTGRLLGGPAESVARSMSALFLPTRAALLWNTFGRSEPWSDFAMGTANEILGRRLAEPGAITHRTGRQADLASWHAAVDPVSRFGLVLVNSSGGPTMFDIAQGPGRPSDIPRGIPAAVAMIHRFSAADPADPQTIAGRWLAQGAFVFFGSMNEPFLLAFRPPQLVAELIDAGAPLGAAVRQGESEPFGFPWRLVYLGDPLYRPRWPGPATQTAQRDATDERNSLARVSPLEWQRQSAESASWPVTEVTAAVSGAGAGSPTPSFSSDGDRLRWCLDAAIADLTKIGPRASLTPATSARVARATPVGTIAWPAVLRGIHRDQLERQLRPVLDDLLIDCLLEAGALEDLQARLAHIPADECGLRVWRAHETCATGRLSRLVRTQSGGESFRQALDLWDEVIRLAWPAGSQFPAHFTERLSALVASDPARRSKPWLERLTRASAELAAQSAKFPHMAAISAEPRRIEARLAPSGSGR